jgi:hypothetical protein
VKSVLKTENIFQIVSVQSVSLIVVLLLVAHVTINVLIVKTNGTTVPSVLISEPQPQSVTVQMDIMKNLI